MTDYPSIHFVYKSRRGLRCDYFHCDADPNENGPHLQTTNWHTVTCPDCLALSQMAPPSFDHFQDKNLPFEVSQELVFAPGADITVPGDLKGGFPGAPPMYLVAARCAVLCDGKLGTVLVQRDEHLIVWLHKGMEMTHTMVSDVELVLLQGETVMESSVARCLYWLAELRGFGDVIPPLLKVDGTGAYVLDGDVQGQHDWTGHDEEKTGASYTPALLDLPDDEWEMLHALRALVLSEAR